ncbi:hypothetical protein JKA74_13070 [Marivirga sp. S37H4]|uniref:Uncharacterized protein n=1 Tax=Marivirga aurantiaca TaxID=2802615 RepID=A0A934WZX7_9BACT|nr:hypothetical protein [Marivirga aurantiaca]MBK6265967.1 hypothetical protein [Marivirga aurantiaca]
MTKIFTHDDLIRYVYEETTTEENRLIEKSLAVDSALLEQCQELHRIKEQLDGSMMSPSEKTINTILEYSKGFNLHPVKD